MDNLPFGVGIDAQNILGAAAARYQRPAIFLWRCVYLASSIHYKHGRSAGSRSKPARIAAGLNFLSFLRIQREP